MKSVFSTLDPGFFATVLLRAGLGLLFLLGGTFPLRSASGGMRTFTDVEGKTIRAELISATATEVKIRRDDGRVFEFSRSRLVDSDQDYIETWIRERAFAFGDLEVSAWRVRLDAERSQTRSIQKIREQWCYKLKLVNESRSDFSGLSIVYRVYYREDVLREGKGKLPLERDEGRIAIGALDAGDEVQLQTEALVLNVSQLKIGWKYSGTGKRRVEDSLEGIWLRVMSDDKLLKEYASPTDLPGKQVW